MKLNKLLLTIPTLAVVTTAPLVLCQCNGGEKTTTTITFHTINCSINRSSLTIDTKTKWSEVKAQITSTPDYGYTNNSEWRIENPTTGALVNDNEPVGNTKSVYILHNEEHQITDGGTKTIDTAEQYHVSSTGNTYTAKENTTTKSPYLQTGSYDNHHKYTFTVTLSESIPKIQYFYFIRNHTLYPFHTNGKNILSVKDGNGRDITYTLKTWNVANDYIEFDPITSGTINITIALHESGTSYLIPIYEGDK